MVPLEEFGISVDSLAESKNIHQFLAKSVACNDAQKAKNFKKKKKEKNISNSGGAKGENPRA